MSFGSYFRVALFLPLVVGLVCMVLSSGGPDRLVRNELVELTAVATLIGGLPYFLYACAVYVWSTMRSDAAIRTWYWLLPMGYLLVLVPVPLILFGAAAVESMPGFLAVLGYFCGFALVYGYAYAILIYLGWLLLKKLFPMRGEQ